MLMDRLIIVEINENNISDVNQCDAEFIIDAKLILRLENDEIHYEVVPIPVSTKRYAADNIDYATYIRNAGRAIYLAYVDGRIAGQIILRTNWNHYCYIEDISVDAQFRRLGIGRQLMAQAQKWAVERNLAGIMLETQNNNVSACRFYEKRGFQLKGFDSYLYKGVERKTDEIALFWYLVFGEDVPG